MKTALHYRDSKGRLVPGVTTILQCLAKPALLTWAAREAVQFVRDHQHMLATDGELVYRMAERAHEDTRQKKTARGTEVHELLADLFTSNPENTSVLAAVHAVTEGWEWLRGEIMVVNDRARYGGTVDAVVRLPDRNLALIDFKTARRAYPENYLQLAMYWLARPKEKELAKQWTSIKQAKLIMINVEHARAQVLDVDLPEHAKVVPSLVKVYRWWSDMQKHG